MVKGRGCLQTLHRYATWLNPPPPRSHPSNERTRGSRFAVCARVCCQTPALAHVSQCSSSEPSLKRQAPVRLHQIHTSRADGATPAGSYLREESPLGFVLKQPSTMLLALGLHGSTGILWNIYLHRYAAGLPLYRPPLWEPVHSSAV